MADVEIEGGEVGKRNCCNIWLEFDDLIDEICRTWPIYTNAYIMAQRWPKCHSNTPLTEAPLSQRTTVRP